MVVNDWLLSRTLHSGPAGDPFSETDVVKRFGGMYRAFQFGAPPHGGMAAGVDRIVMLLCGTTNCVKSRYSR